MAKVKLYLSSKQDDFGKKEILIRFFNGSQFNLRGRSEIFVNPKFFEYTIINNVNAGTATEQEAERKGYQINKYDGKIVIRQRVETEEVKYHKNAQLKLNQLCNSIMTNYQNADKSTVKGDWLKNIILYTLHPEHKNEQNCNKSFSDWAEEYIEGRKISISNIRTVRCDVRHVLRFEGFVRATKDKEFRFDVNTVTRDTIDFFIDYLRKEYKLQNKYPTLFKTLISDIPNRTPKSSKRGKKISQKIEERSENTITKIGQQIQSIFIWLYDEKKITNRPFEGVKFSAPIYGTPWYITQEERDLIASFAIDDERLKIQRDIFIFHTYVGARISDLIKFSEKNITGETLLYTPHKTSRRASSDQAIVPLHKVARDLIEKYRGVDKNGRLFPFISPQKYNDALKKIFSLAGISRAVEVRNPRSGEMELKPINTIVSSHMSRRTFIGNLYLHTPDPSLIGKMSGHVEGSRAFRRYRDIKTEQLKELINKL